MKHRHLLVKLLAHLKKIDENPIIHQDISVLPIGDSYNLFTPEEVKEIDALEDEAEKFLKGLMETIVIAAFPGCGKSYATGIYPHLHILDSDSSTFDKSDFPANYIRHIKENIGKCDVIFVSSHQEVRDALVEEGIFFTLVLPHPGDKESYIARYYARGSSDNFIKLIAEHWSEWVGKSMLQKGALVYMLPPNSFISERLSHIRYVNTKHNENTGLPLK